MTQSQDSQLQNLSMNLLCLLCNMLYLFAKEQLVSHLVSFIASSIGQDIEDMTKTVLRKEVSRKSFSQRGSWFFVSRTSRCQGRSLEKKWRQLLKFFPPLSHFGRC